MATVYRTTFCWLFIFFLWFDIPFALGQGKTSDVRMHISQPFPNRIIRENEYTITGYVHSAKGVWFSNPTNYISTDYINVEDCEIIECRLPPSKDTGITFFNASKHFISGLNSETGGMVKLKMPSGTSFIRLSKRTDLQEIEYWAKLYFSQITTYNALLNSNNATIQRLDMGLYSALAPDYSPVFRHGDFAYNAQNEKKTGKANRGYNVNELFYPRFRIPIHLKTKHGTILVAANAIYNQNNADTYTVVIARSTNGGKTFEKRTLCKGWNLSMVYDEQNDHIFFFQGLTYAVSTDDGKTWSEFKSLGIEKPKGWEKFYASPTVGIQLSNGILAVPYILMNGSGPEITLNANAIVYSADFGKTWKITAVTPDTIIANETTIAEYAPNQIMINARGGTEVHWGSPNPGRRVFVPVTLSKSDRKDWHVKEWELHESDKQLIEPICNASFIASQYGKHRFGLFCNPHTTGKERKNLMLQVSSDFTHWTKVGLLTPFNRVVYGYCSLNYQNGRMSFVFEDKKCGILYADLTPFMDEILTKMIANKMLYKQD